MKAYEIFGIFLLFCLVIFFFMSNYQMRSLIILGVIATVVIVWWKRRNKWRKKFVSKGFENAPHLLEINFSYLSIAFQTLTDGVGDAICLL